MLINLVLTEGTPKRRNRAVEDVQRLPNDVQTYLMKMLKLVCDFRNDEQLVDRLMDFIRAGMLFCVLVVIQD